MGKINGCSIVNTKNRIISQNIQISIDTEYTNLNNNIIVIGGPGSGKSYRIAKPNIMQMTGSYIITDPKGELLRDTAGFLKAHGYEIKVLNLLNAKEMKKSTRYNPFKYLKYDVDVITLISQLISNTTPKGVSPSDPFWEKAEGMFLQSLFYYVWKEGVKMPDGTVQHNIPAVMELIKKAEIKEDPVTGMRMDSELDILMSELEERDPEHLAVINYNKSMRGAADTVRSVLMEANSRLATLENKEIQQLLSEDEMDLASLGREKVALYCVIPDNNKSYNYIVGLLYSQMYQELYYQADFVYGGKLPVHVTCLLDEFANVALPDDFCSLLSTMRSRNISSIIIIQNMAQIKKLFKDDYETLPGNSSVLIYLGSNEKQMHKYLCESMGKMTIDKRTSSVTKSKQGSSSFSNDIMSREIMTEAEVRKLNRKKCIVLIEGFDPVIDDKIATNRHPFWPELCRTKKTFFFDARLERVYKKSQIGLCTGAKLKTLKMLDEIEQKEYKYELMVSRKTGENPPKEPKKRVMPLSIRTLLEMDFEHAGNDFEEFVSSISREEMLANRKKEQEKEKREQQIKRKKIEEREKLKSLNKKGAELYLRLQKEGYTKEQTEILLQFQNSDSYSPSDVIEIFSPDMENEILDSLVKTMM